MNSAEKNKVINSMVIEDPTFKQARIVQNDDNDDDQVITTEQLQELRNILS